MGDTEVTFSVVVPLSSARRQGQQTICAIGDMAYPRHALEVLLMDAGNDPLTAQALTALTERGIQYRRLRQTSGSRVDARNQAARFARGRFIAFTDEFCAPSPQWLCDLEPHLRACPGAMVGGRIAAAAHICSQAQQQIIGFHYAYFDGGPGRPRWFRSSNLAVGRDTFIRLGGFDGSLPQAAADRDLCDRWTQFGLPTIYAPDAVVSFSDTGSLRSFWRHQFDDGRGAWQLAGRRRDAEVCRIPLRFHRDLILHSLRARPDWRGVTHAALLLTGQIASAAGYCAARLRLALRQRAIPRPALRFITPHIAALTARNLHQR